MANSPPFAASPRIPSLDGLRALSISLVISGHLGGTQNAYRLLPYMSDVALCGVRIFFMISGFLITFLLLREHNKEGKMSLKSFYIRRTLRILPVFYSYLAVLMLLTGARVLHVGLRDFLKAGTCVANLFPVGWDLGHFWSLSTEEQFYLLWPTLLVLVGIKRSVAASAVLMILSPFISRMFWQRGTLYVPLVLLSVNALAGGCLLAGLRPRLHLSRRYLRLLQSHWPPALGLAAFFLHLWHGRGGILLYSVGTVFGLLFIDQLITVTNALTWLLNLRPIVFLGVLSYSIYVWQQMFLDRDGTAAFNAFPLNLILALACGIASYYFIEKPFLRLRAKITATASAATEQPTDHALTFPSRLLTLIK